MSRFPRPFLPLVYLLICVSAGAAEREVSPPPVGPAFGEQNPVAIAFRGGDGFVIWNDRRAGDSWAAYGSRIDPSGALLDPHGIRFGGLPHTVLWGRDSWVVITSDFTRVYGQRVGTTGQLLGPRTVLMARSGESVRAASNGTTIVVTNFRSQDHYAVIVNAADLSAVRVLDTTLIRTLGVVSDGKDYIVFGYLPYLHGGVTVQAARFDSTGELVVQKDTGIDQPFRTATWTGRDYLVASGERVVLHRLSPDLSAVSGPFVLTETQAFVQLAGDGEGGALAVWGPRQWSDDFQYTSFATRVEAASVGMHVMLERVQWSSSEPPPPIQGAAIPNGFVFVGRDMRSLAVSRDLSGIAANALSNRPELTRSLAAQYRFAPVRDGSSDLYVFIEEDGVSSRVMIGRHGSSARRLVDTGFAQHAPSIASSGNTALVTWIEKRTARNEPYTVFGLLVDRDGHPLQTPFVLGPEPRHYGNLIWGGGDYSIWPAGVVWSGSMYLVFWNGAMARVLEYGPPLDPAPRTLFRDQVTDHVTMARFGERVLAVWMTGGSLRGCGGLPCASYATLRAARFTPDGQLLDVEPLEFAGAGGLTQVAVNGDVALIVSDYAVGFRFDSNGVVTRFNYARDGIRPTVAAHLDGFLVAWQESQQLFARTVSRNLNMSAPFVLASDSPVTQGPQAWTTATGPATVAYLRVGPHTEWVPRLYRRTFDDSKPTRTRAVRR